MDSDHDSGDDWVFIDSGTSSDDDRVVALSSGCDTPSTPGSASASDTDSSSSTGSRHLLATASAAIACATADDAEGVYGLSDAEDEDYAYPPPSPPHPRPLSGLFHHTRSPNPGVAYAAFEPVPAPSFSAPHHHAAKQLVPDPTFSAFFCEPVRALASTRGLVCLRGASSGAYYVANPATFARAELPRPARDHAKFGDPAALIVFDLDAAAAPDHDYFYRHYHVVVAFPLGEGIYAFEAFSSRIWEWTIADSVAPAETVIQSSGVAALGCAFWRTTMGLFLCFEPVSGCADLVPAPQELDQWPCWELAEMDGVLCATCMDERVTDVVVVCLDLTRRSTTGWTLAGHFEGGFLRGRTHVQLLRSQGKPEVVMWDPQAETVVAMDLEGRTTRTISFLPGSGYHDDFIPYVRSLAGISPSGHGPLAECWIPATNGVPTDECRAMAETC